MKLYYSKWFVLALIVLIAFFITGFILKLPFWIAILLLVPILQFTFHEYVHAIVAWLHGAKVEYIMCNFSNMCCKLVPLPQGQSSNTIYYRVIFSGGLFQTAIYSFEITLLVLSGLSLHNPMPFIFAFMFLSTFIIYDIVPSRCDIRRTYNYAKWLESQHLSPLNPN